MGPRNEKFTTDFERLTNKFVNNNTKYNLQDISKEVLENVGFRLDLYEDRIEHWTSTWKTNDLKQCSLCCFWGSTTDMGYTDDDEKLSDETKQDYKSETKCETKSEPLCDHGASFCRDCLKQYFTLQMKEAPGIQLPLTGITCPNKCCTPVLDSVVQKLLGEEKFRPLATKMRTRRIMARPNLRFCSNDGCGMEISVVGTKLRVLSSTPVARLNMFGGPGNSSSFTHRWYSVSVRELIPGNKITRTPDTSPDTYRIEYESVTKPDEVIELIHLPLLNFGKGINLDTLPKLSQNKTDDSGTVIPTPKTYYFFENEDDSVLPAIGAKFLPGEIVGEMKTGYTTSAYGTNKPTFYQIENIFQSPGKQTTKSEALYVVRQLNKKSTDPKMILKQEKDLQTNDRIQPSPAFRKKDGAGGWIEMLQRENKQMFNNFHNRRSNVDRSPGTEVNGRAVIDTSCSNDCWKCQFSICNKCGQAAHHGTTCNANADDALLALSKDREKFVQCPKCRGVLSRIAGCDHMTCSTAGQGCSAEFCFECLSMPHCGTSCKKPEKAKQLRMEWKKERDEREHQNMYGSETKEDIKEDAKEENLEETVFSERSKMYNLQDTKMYTLQDTSSIIWKQIGKGQLKILKHKVTGKYRILMLHGRTKKIICNAPITGNELLTYLTAKQVTMTVQHFDAETAAFVQKTVAFKLRTPEMEGFKKAFAVVSGEISSPKLFDDSSTPAAEANDAPFVWGGPVAEGSWICSQCDVTNNKDEFKCPCCEYENPNAPTNTEASINRSPSLYTYGRYVQGNSSPAAFSFGGSSTPSTPSARCNGRGECSLGCVCNDLGSIDGPLDDL